MIVFLLAIFIIFLVAFVVSHCYTISMLIRNPTFFKNKKYRLIFFSNILLYILLSSSFVLLYSNKVQAIRQCVLNLWVFIPLPGVVIFHKYLFITKKPDALSRSLKIKFTVASCVLVTSVVILLNVFLR